MKEKSWLSSPDGQVWLIRGGMAVAAVVGLGIAMPVIYSAFLSSLGLFGIAVVGGAGYALIHAAPLLAQKWENNILKWQKQEAATNPIEQLQNELLKRKRDITEAEIALSRLQASLEGQKRKLEERERTHPNHDLTRPKATLQRMYEFFARNKENLTETVKKCKEYEERLDNAMFERDFTATGNQILATSAAESDPLRKLLEDVSFQTVSREFDEVFARLEVRSLVETAQNYENDVNTQAHMSKQEVAPNERVIG